MQETIITMNGVSVIIIGAGGALEKMFVISNGKITTENSIMMIVSLVLGAIIGEQLQIDEKVNQFVNGKL